jgi:hypothetical protein
MHSLEIAEGHLSRVENALNAVHGRLRVSSQPADRYYMLIIQEATLRVQKARHELTHLNTIEIEAQW